MITEHELRDRLETILKDITTEYHYTITMLDGELECQVKATLSRQEVKLKTSDQKEASQEDQPEHVSSTLNNDQTLPEKGQKPKTKSPSKQYIVSYPVGTSIDPDTGKQFNNYNLADTLAKGLKNGKSISIPNTWKVQVIDL